MNGRNWIRLGTVLVGLSIVFIMVGVLMALTPPELGPSPGTDFGGYRPHYQGPGTTTPGGRGGPVCIVNTLDDSQPATFIEGMGTLRRCVGRRAGCDGTAARCSRFALIAISGTVDLLAGQGVLFIEDPFLTLACQTAPTGREGSGDTGIGGFTIKGNITIRTNDLVLQHCRVRLIKGWGEAMTVNVGDPITGAIAGHDVVLDHLSTSWATISGNIAVNYGATNVAILDTILAEPIRRQPNDGQYGYGAMLYSAPNSTLVLARSYLVHQQVRNPSVGTAHPAIYNNVLYDGGDNYWASQGDHMAGNAIAVQRLGPVGGSESGIQTAIVNNVIRNGPTTSNTLRFSIGLDVDEQNRSANHRVYVSGNTGPGISSAQNQAGGVQYFDIATKDMLCNQSCFDTTTFFDWFKAYRFAIMPTANVVDYVLTNVGAFATDRDAVDARVVQDYRNGTGDAKLDSENDVGGFPPIAVRMRAIPLPANPSAIHTATDFGRGFRTELEYFLEKDPAFGAERLEPGAPSTLGTSASWLWPGAALLLALGLVARHHGHRTRGLLE